MGLFNKRDDRELIPIGWALTLTLLVALAVIGGLLWLAWALLGPPEFVREQVALTAYLDIVKIVLAVVAGLGGVVALVVAYRRQRTGERAEQREQARLENERIQVSHERTRLLNERFTSASEQLGSDKPAVRLAGVHAMANLADDWDDNHEARQMCIDVLCSYLRMADTFIPKELRYYDSLAGQEEIDVDSSEDGRDNSETRHTILRTIASHLREGGTIVSWCGYNFDLRGITIDLDLDFSGAKFREGKLDFGDARLIGDGAVWFSGAKFAGGKLLFDGAKVSGRNISFAHAEITGGEIGFRRARFLDGMIWFLETQFIGGEVSFHEAALIGGNAWFYDTQFLGGILDFSTTMWREPPDGLPDSAPGLRPPSTLFPPDYGLS